MGGLGSGQHGGRPTTESGLTLNLSRLLRQRCLMPGATTTGTLSWTNKRTGQETGSLSFEGRLDEDHGHLSLRYSAGSAQGERQAIESRIGLVTTAQHYGGLRWWFVCPREGRRCLKLYKPNGATHFASRQACRLAYRTQRETRMDRDLSRAFRLRARIGGTGGIGDPIEKPKGMHWRTFERELDRVFAAEEVCNLNLLGSLRRFGLGLGGLDSKAE